ncbi:MAG: hypothetical protein AAGD14_15365 [Planctomycetota bacterium]
MPRLAVLLLLGSLAVAASPKGLRWATSWSEALAEGQATNLPIVVHRHGFY